MNIVLINDTGVETFKSWREVGKYTSFKKEEFTQIGKDYVLNCNNESYEISKDIKLLERVASERVFTKSGMDMSMLMIGFTALMSLLIYMQL